MNSQSLRSWLALVCLLAGCTNYAALSAKHTECLRSEITVTRLVRTWERTSWYASCHGVSYVCKQVPTSEHAMRTSCESHDLPDIVSWRP